MERNILQALWERHVYDPDFDDLPSQNTLAGWAGYHFDTTFKTALSGLVKACLLGNGKHHGRRGGYYLTERGNIAGGLIAKMTGHD